MIKAVIFDMDGLMFDTESAYSVVQSRMSEKRGKIFTNGVKAPLMGKKAHEVMSLLNDFWGGKEKVEDLLAEQDKELIEIYKKSVGKLNGLDDLILFLRENKVSKCIGTSSRKFLVDILIDKYGLRDEFEFVISGDMVSNGKPDPEIYDLCVSRLGLSPQSCLVLEDSLNGVRAGVAAGCWTCAIPSQYTEDENFSIADMRCSSLGCQELKDFILAKQKPRHKSVRV